jgi:hypothetical protein
LGAFKRGKSTLINALLGKPVLPTAIVPLTSVVTILNYGERLDVEVFFSNAEHPEVSAGELVDYIAETGSPRNKKGVQELVDQHCGRVRYDFDRRLEEIAK